MNQPIFHGMSHQGFDHCSLGVSFCRFLPSYNRPKSIWEDVVSHWIFGGRFVLRMGTMVQTWLAGKWTILKMYF